MPKQPGERTQVPPATQTTQPVGTEGLPPTTLEAALQELGEALERETATSEILQAISMSPTDIRPVLEAIVENARRFCAAGDAALMLPDGNHMRLAAHGGSVPVASDLRYPNDGTSVSSRAFLEARTIAIQDLQIATEFPLGAENARSEGYHSILVAPLLRKGASVGTIALRRFDTRPFTRRQIELLETFAAQAAIAIENVRLFNETNEALAQQTAVAEVLKTISRSALDLQSVLDTVVENAAQLCDADAAWVTSPSVERRLMAFSSGVPLERRRAALDIRPTTSGTLGVMQQVYATGKTSHIPDIATDPELYAAAPVVREMGGRTVLAVPVLREGHPIAGIVLTRGQVRPFSDREVELAETFASQAGIAIENVRLFNETKEALERQTATGEILRAIAGSPTNEQPVLDAIARSAVRFCGAQDVLVLLRVGEGFEVVAHEGPITLSRSGPSPLIPTHVSGRAILNNELIHVPDIRMMATEFPMSYELALGSGQRGILSAPLLREGKAIGAISLRRLEPGPFSEWQIGLAETFAAQAVIAIENVRLFNGIREKSGQLEVANDELAAASRHKSEFLANMSHELRTPLNAIIGFSEVLEQRLFGELNERQAEYTHDIATSGRHLLTLVNEILDLAKVEAGRMELEPSAFAPAETIRGALGFVRERAAEHRISLGAELPEDLGTLVADERKVRQVLLNLLSNAVKFTPDGGRVTLRARCEDGELEVAVQDTGIGIAPEDLPRVFEEFQQVGTTSERSREGTGLGLTLAKRFIELHGGRIWVESKVGTGTTFTFAIPLDQAAAPRSNQVN